MIRLQEPPTIRRFRIICMKRSKFKESEKFDYTSDWYNASKIVYWRDNRAGYTSNIREAGEYTIEEINMCAGSWMDWILEPVWR